MQADRAGVLAGGRHAGVSGRRRGAAIFKDAPHPNAAKLYLNRYMAKDQQSRSGTFSLRADVPPPPGLQPLSSHKIDSGYRKLVSDEARLADLRKRFAAYIGKR